MRLYVYQIEHAEGDHVILSAMEPLCSHLTSEAVCIGTIEVKPLTPEIEGEEGI